MTKKREGKLYGRSAEGRFEKRYGRKKGRGVWGSAVGKVRRERIEKGELPKKHAFRSRKAALNLAKELRKSGRPVRITVTGLVRKKYTVHVR